MADSKQIYWQILKKGSFSGSDWLSESEMLKYQSLHFEKRKSDWLAGRWAAKNLLIRSALNQHTVRPADISLENEASGAPYVIWNSFRLPGSISISHRDGTAAAAWTSNPAYALGIDLEMVEAKQPVFVEDYFTAAEREFVFSQLEADQALYASLIWSAKEAVMKALLSGLRVDTRQIEIYVPLGGQAEGWQALKITHQPPGLESCRLYWRKLEEMLLTLAIATHSAVDLGTLPKNLVEIR